MKQQPAGFPTAGRSDVSRLLGAAANAVSVASDEAFRHGFGGTQEDLDQIFLELVRVQSSLWAFRHRAYRTMRPEADWLRPDLPF